MRKNLRGGAAAAASATGASSSGDGTAAPSDASKEVRHVQTQQDEDYCRPGSNLTRPSATSFRFAATSQKSDTSSDSDEEDTRCYWWEKKNAEKRENEEEENCPMSNAPDGFVWRHCGSFGWALCPIPPLPPPGRPEEGVRADEV